MPVLFFLRSYGDFTIAIAVLRKTSLPIPIRLVASEHLKPLYLALRSKLKDMSLNIEFVDFKISHKIMGYLTNRHSFDLHSFNELMALRQFMRQQPSDTTFLFEQCRKLWFLGPAIGFLHPAVHASGNVYDSYCKLLDVDRDELLFSSSLREKRKILILPESRKPQKALPVILVKDTCRRYLKEGHDVTIAFFQKIPYETPGKSKVHVAFGELIQLVMDSDEIITADSLPAHLAQLFEKPHFVLYKGKPDKTWFTPFVRNHQSFDNF